MSVLRSRVSSALVLGFVLLAPGVGAQEATQAASVPAHAVRLRDSAITLLERVVPIGDIPGIRGAQALLARALSVAPQDPWLLHYYGFALYREATLSFGMGRDGYIPILEKADSVLELAAKYERIPETNALRSSAIGMMIGSNPLRGMTMGPKASAQMDEAAALGPRNPRVWLLRGIGALNTPAMFGGGEARAESYLKKAIDLFASDNPDAPAPRWGANEAHAWLGQLYVRQDKTDLARAEYLKALAIQPNDMWVKMSLLPVLDAKKK
ncbi:MAG TPA: hypothetical protein VEB19_02615 [Gemmatimonadaceae bacterium]|nr:hypothetical protein [Gemmatimonadaceae bacterium]